MPYADIDGTLLVISDTGGDGPPVLFCHGQRHGSGAGAYDHQVEALGDIYRVVTARLRDDAPQPPAASDPWGLATTLFGLLDAIGIERAVLCGADDAAAVIVRAALLHPDRVRGLVLLHAALPDADDPDHLDDRLEELAMPVLLVHGDADPDRPVALAHAMADVVSDPRGVVEVAGGDRLLATTHGALVTDAIRDYLEGLPA
jgi:pimeloyl-ACP methyl ester carboxylesterase